MNENHRRVLAAYLDDMERKLREVQTDLAASGDFTFVKLGMDERNL